MPGTNFRQMGSLFPTTVVRQKEHSEGPIDGRLAFNDAIYLFNSLLVKTTPTTPAGGTLTRRWTFRPDNFGPNNLQTYTIEMGGAAGAERVVYGLVNALTIRVTEEETAVTGTIIGKKTVEGITITPTPTDIPERVVGPTQVAIYIGTAQGNEVQTVDIGAPSAGTFRLTFRHPNSEVGQQTATIAFNALGAAVQSALEALSQVGTGNVTVTGIAGGPYTVTFVGALAGINVDPLVIDGTALTGGTPLVTTVTAGGMTKLLRCHEFELALTGRVTMGRTLDPAEPSFTYVVERPPEASGTIVLQHDSVSKAFMDNMRATDTLLCKMVAEGSLIEAGFPHRIALTFPFKFRDTERGDRQDVWASTYHLTPVYDGTFAAPCEAIVDCPLTAL